MFVFKWVDVREKTNDLDFQIYKMWVASDLKFIEGKNSGNEL